MAELTTQGPDEMGTLRAVMRALRSVGIVAPLLAFFIGISSFLGLNPGLVTFHAGLADVIATWQQSRTANVLFIVGSASSAILSFLVGRRSLRWGILTGLVTAWLTYALSYMSLPDLAPFDVSDMMMSFLGVAVVGFLGLLFAGLAPAIAARIWLRRAAARRSPTGVVEFEIVDESRRAAP